MASLASRPRNPVLLGIVITAVCVSFLPMGDAISKHLMQRISPIEVVWGRYVVQLVIAIVVVAANMARLGSAAPGTTIIATRQWRLQILRGVAVFASSLCLIASFQFIPLVDAISIIFLGPILAVILSARLLGERVGWHRWAAVCVGFLSVLMILKPGMGLVHWAASLALVAALINSSHQLMTRRLAATEPALTTFAWSSAAGLAAATLALPFGWTAPAWADWALLSVGGIFLAIAQYGQVLALRFAPVSAVAPFNYTTIPAALVVGFVVFGELPDAMGFAGATLLILAGLYAFRRERTASV
ncbi:MAG: DMT family transporter [Alphaproteobacteria bacterium]|nr:DMT family transporter [Alphaproteobacteria bacterium]